MLWVNDQNPLSMAKVFCQCSINLAYSHSWNAVVMSGLLLLVAATWNCWISYKNGHAGQLSFNSPSVAASLVNRFLVCFNLFGCLFLFYNMGREGVIIIWNLIFFICYIVNQGYVT